MDNTELANSLKAIAVAPPVQIAIPVAWRDAAVSAIEKAEALRKAMERIEGQAVCVNMDGDDGNEWMLKNIIEMARGALDAYRGDVATATPAS